MPTTTIRVSYKTREALQSIAEAQGMTIQEATQQAVETYRRQQLLATANAAYAKIREDAKASEAFSEELSVWDGTLADGLEDY